MMCVWEGLKRERPNRGLVMSGAEGSPVKAHRVSTGRWRMERCNRAPVIFFVRLGNRRCSSARLLSDISRLGRRHTHTHTHTHTHGHTHAQKPTPMHTETHCGGDTHIQMQEPQPPITPTHTHTSQIPLNGWVFAYAAVPIIGLSPPPRSFIRSVRGFNESETGAVISLTPPAVSPSLRYYSGEEQKTKSSVSPWAFVESIKVQHTHTNTHTDCTEHINGIYLVIRHDAAACLKRRHIFPPKS